jgi:type IX secretion system PorP/SprF family membrane protein
MVFMLTLSIVVILVASKRATGQDAIFSQFYANPLYLNPAFAGAGQCSRLNMNYRNQPFPDFGTYSTYSISADTRVEKLSGGLGFNVVHDNQGSLIGSTQAGAFYAWQNQLSRQWNINIGMQVSYFNSTLHTSRLIFPDQQFTSGGEIMPSDDNVHAIDFSSGILIYSDRFYSGVSVHHLNQPRIGLFDDHRLEMKYSFMAGYNYSLGENSRNSLDNISVSPNVIVQLQGPFARINYGMYARVENFSAGVWFRQNLRRANTLIFTVGIMQVNYAISYSYDYSLSGFSGVAGGAHEIGVLLNFNCRDPKSRYRILNCPTF